MLLIAGQIPEVPELPQALGILCQKLARCSITFQPYIFIF